MNRRFELTDDEWERLSPLLPAMPPQRGGPWETVYMRFARWQTDGTWARIQAMFGTQADGAGELDWDVQIDASAVRAHQHAAGAGKGGSPRSRQAASRRWGGRGVG